MIIIILITLFPFYWMLRTALSTSKSLFSDPSSLLPVTSPSGAFERVLGLATPEEARAEGGSGAAVNFWLYLRNSLIFATVCTVGQVFFCALAAYAFARLRWPGRDKVFFLFLTALMVPPIFTLLPNFILIRNLGLLNTFAGTGAALRADDAVRDLLPAAVLPRHQPRDRGGGQARRRRALPDLLPDHPADERARRSPPWRILTFITMWNEYFWPLLVGTSEQTRVLTVALGVFKSQTPPGARTGPA